MPSHGPLRIVAAILASLVPALAGCGVGDSNTPDSAKASLRLDDDRATPTTTLAVRVLRISKGTQTDFSLIAGGQVVTYLAPDTYTITYDDDGTPGFGGSDTQVIGVVLENGKSTTIEYSAPATTTVVGPTANG